jgi:hypothetical protein
MIVIDLIEMLVLVGCFQGLKIGLEQSKFQLLDLVVVVVVVCVCVCVDCRPL